MFNGFGKAFAGKRALSEGSLSLDDIWSAVAGDDAGRFRPPEEWEGNDEKDGEGPERPDLQTDYIDDAKALSGLRPLSKEYSDEERTLIGGSLTKGLDRAVKTMVQRFLSGNPPRQFSGIAAKMLRFPELDASDYSDFALNYIRKNGLSDFSKAAGDNLGWENEHIAKAVQSPEVQGELSSIQKERDSKLSGMDEKPSDGAKWSPRQADVHFDAMSKTGDVLGRALSGISQNMPKSLSGSIDELYQNLPSLVAKAVELRILEYSFEGVYRKLRGVLSRMRTPKKEMPGVVSKMMGGVEPYQDETVTNPLTGEKSRRWDSVHRRISSFSSPVSPEELDREIRSLPASPFESRFHSLGMPFSERVCSLAAFLYPEMRSMQPQDILQSLSSDGDSSMIEGMAQRIFRILSSKRMDRLSSEASAEAQEEAENRKYLQRSADSYARFNSDDGEEDAEGQTRTALSKLPVSDRNRMVAEMVKNRIVPGDELFKYLEGISGGVLGEARVFRPNGILPPDLPPRPGSRDDFQRNPETGELARRPETGSPIRVNRDSVARAALRDLSEPSGGPKYQAIGVGNRYPGTLEAEQFVEILDAYLGHRTFEEGAISLSTDSSNSMSGKPPRGRGRQSANSGRLATWYAEFLRMLQDTPEQDRADFFASCQKAGFPIDESKILDWNAPESERVSLGRAYLLFNWTMKSGRPASDISINSLFLPDAKGLAQHLFKSRVLYSPNNGNPVVWGGDKREFYFGTRDEAIANASKPPVSESVSRTYDSLFNRIYSEILLG